MAFTTGESCLNKVLLLCPTSIPDQVQNTFTRVFRNVPRMIDYVYEVLAKTDTFHLIIPFGYFIYVYNDPIYSFKQIVQIDVVCDTNGDMEQMKSRFALEHNKLKFYTLKSLLESLRKAELDRALHSSNSNDQSSISNIISFIEHCLSVKRRNSFLHRSEILKQSASTSLHGFPVKNISDFHPDFLCPACQLVYQQLYRLECQHRQCQICVRTQKK